MTESTEVLKDLGYNVIGSCEQYQISSNAAVLRIPTSRGRVYLKASNKREGLTMKCVAGFAPFLVPTPLYVDAENELMIMNDHGPTLADRFSAEDYNKMVMLHGKMQVASLEHIKVLKGIGILYVDFSYLSAKAKELLEDPDVEKSLQEL